MQIHDSVASFRVALATANGVVGFVPTMGALHAGHLSLVERSAIECDTTVMSIFVNPLQFGAAEDLTRYPRPFDDDCAVAERAGVDHLFAPSKDEMYPGGDLHTCVRVAGVSEPLEGASRPGHFDGVATVVSKLFNIVGSCRAYFGEKDWQQLEVVRRLVADLSAPVEIIGCPIVREVDGLAMSSRNVYLDQVERVAALRLQAALVAGQNEIAAGVSNSSDVVDVMVSMLAGDPVVAPEYAAHVGKDMTFKAKVEKGDRLLVAARVGNTRLIDNVEVV